MYVVAGASNNTGRVVAETLLAQKKPVRVIARNKEHVQDLQKRGAEVMVGDLTDAAFLTRALKGATAAYLMVPSNISVPSVRDYYTKHSEAAVKAIKDSGIKHVVSLSSMGAHLAEGTGPIAHLHRHEERLNKLSDVNVLHLRPTWFMENLFSYIGMIDQLNTIAGATKADLVFPVISVQDVGKYAAERMLKLDWKNHTTRELRGAEDSSMKAMTKIVGEAIAKPNLKYNEVAYADAEQGMTRMGMSSDMAKSYVEMTQAFNDGRAITKDGRTKENTTPMRFAAWVQSVFAPAYKNNLSAAE